MSSPIVRAVYASSARAASSSPASRPATAWLRSRSTTASRSSSDARSVGGRPRLMTALYPVELRLLVKGNMPAQLQDGGAAFLPRGAATSPRSSLAERRLSSRAASPRFPRNPCKEGCLGRRMFRALLSRDARAIGRSGDRAGLDRERQRRLSRRRDGVCREECDETTVRVGLPSRPPRAVPIAQGEMSTLAGAKPLALVADDDCDILSLLASCLQRPGSVRGIGRTSSRRGARTRTVPAGSKRALRSTSRSRSARTRSARVVRASTREER